MPAQIFIPEEVAPFNWNDEEGEDSKELQLVAEEEAEDVATAAFLKAPIRRRRRWKLSHSSLESRSSGLFDSQEADSSDSPFKGSSDGSNSKDDEGVEEGEEDDDNDDDDEEEMEYLALDYPQKDSRDDTDAYAPRSPWVALCWTCCCFFLFLSFFIYYFFLAIFWLRL